MGTSIHPQGKSCEIQYRDWADYLEAFKDLDPKESWGDAQWGGCKDLGTTLQVARKGWPEGMAHARKVALPALQAATTAQAPVDDWTWDVTGSTYDVAEYLAGTPECWLTRDAYKTKPAITIVVNITSSASVPADTIRTRGAAVAALAMHLEASGYAVEVWSAWGVEGWNGDKRWVRACLTDMNGGPIDVDRLLFGLAHPAAGRQLGHFMVSSGTPIDNPPWKSDLYLPCMHIGKCDDWRNVDTVTAWVERTYNDLTGANK